MEERLARLRAALQQASRAGLSVDVTKEADEALVALKARRAVWGELEQAAASEDHDVRHTDVSPEVGAAIVATYLELLKVDSNRDDGAKAYREVAQRCQTLAEGLAGRPLREHLLRCHSEASPCRFSKFSRT